MKLLLDTHVFLWWRENGARIRRVRTAIATADTVLVSAASAWEVAIKASLGKIRVPESFEQAVEDSQFEKLAIEFRHAALVPSLPAYHTDPFDRMRIAQAHVEGLTLVTHDRALEPYGVPILWA